MKTKGAAAFTMAGVLLLTFLQNSNASGLKDIGFLKKQKSGQPAAKKKPDPPLALVVRDKWAVLIGIDRYQDPSIPNLRYAKQNLILLRDVLRSPDFGRYAPDHTRILYNTTATKAQIESVLSDDWLLMKALPADLILVYICGRCTPSQGDAQYLAYDASPAIYADSGLSIKGLLTEIRRRTQCKNIVCLLDLSPATNDHKEKPDLAEISKETKVTFLSANSLDHGSAESSQVGNSLFAHYLAEGIKAGAGAMSLDTVAQYVSQNAAADAQSQLSTVEEVEYFPNPDNSEIGKIALGVPAKLPAVLPPVKIGHPLDTLALKRPDLEEATAPGARNRSPAPRDDDDEDENDAKLRQEVDYSPYMSKMKKDIQSKWKPPAGLAQRTVVAMFSIMRDGSISDPSIVESSGLDSIDQSALECLKSSSPLDPLPKGAPRSIRIRYKFDWKVTHQ